MKHSIRITLISFFGFLAFALAGCGALPQATTPTPSKPAVEIGFLHRDSDSKSLAAFVDYEPGMTLSAVYSPAVADNSARHSLYKETISYPSGKTIEVEFFIASSGPEGTEYEVSINGSVTKVQDTQEAQASLESKVKDKIAFTFFPYPGTWKEPLMKLPALCDQPTEMREKYSTLPDKEWFQSLDSLSVKCPSTGKTTTFAFSYERQKTGDPIITSFTVKTDQTGGK